jgi:hypothetical protein
MAEEQKPAPKPDDVKGKDKRFNEPLMNFELPPDSKPEMQSLGEPLEAAEVVEEDIPVAEEEPVVVELDDAAVEVVEDEPVVVESAADSDAVAAQLIEDDEPQSPPSPTVKAAKSDESDLEEEVLEVAEAAPSSSSVIDAPLVDEAEGSGIDLTSTKKPGSGKTTEQPTGESDIDINALLDDSGESSAIDLNRASAAPSAPVSPAPRAIGAEDGEHVIDVESIVDSAAAEGEKNEGELAPPIEAPAKKGRSKEPAGAGGRRGGFVPFLFGGVLAAALIGGGGATAWYLNMLPQSPGAEKAPLKKAFSPAPVAAAEPKGDADDNAEKLVAAQAKVKELEAAQEASAGTYKQLEQEHNALKSALADAKVPVEPDKLKEFAAELQVARKAPAENKEPVAKAEGNPEDANKLKELAAANETLTKERDAAIKDRDEAMKGRDALLKDPDAASKEREALVKERDDAIKDRENLAKDRETLLQERDAAVKNLETTAKERDALAKESESLKAAVAAATKQQQNGKQSVGNVAAPAKQPPAITKNPTPVPPAVVAPQEAAQPNPAMAEKHFSRGLDFFWAKRYSDAEGELVKAVVSYDEDARYRYFLGMARYMQGTTDKRLLAGQDFEKGVQLERARHPSAREVNASLERVQGSLRSLIEGYRERPPAGGR